MSEASSALVPGVEMTLMIFAEKIGKLLKHPDLTNTFQRGPLHQPDLMLDYLILITYLYMFIADCS